MSGSFVSVITKIVIKNQNLIKNSGVRRKVLSVKDILVLPAFLAMRAWSLIH